MGIPDRHFFAGLRFSHQLLLPSGYTFHITPFLSLSLCVYDFFYLLFFILTLSLLKLFDIKTLMGLVSFQWRFSSMVEKGLWFWKRWHMTINVSWPTSWQHISFTRLILLVLSLVCMPLSPALYLLICCFFFLVSLTLSIKKKTPLMHYYNFVVTGSCHLVWETCFRFRQLFTIRR